nr:unnamed protein product [Spirometra erinaceieuropaei]
MLLNRMNKHLEQGFLPEGQCDFRRHCGTTDIIFAARQLQENCQEMRNHLYSTFANLMKDYYTPSVYTTTIHELLYASDCASNSTSEGDMQWSMNLLAAACESFDLIVNSEQTEVMHQPPPDAAYVAPIINVNGTQPQAVDNFTYLGSTLSRNTKIDGEVARRISKASQTFGRLQSSLESPRSPPRHQNEDEKGGLPTGAAVWNGDLDDVQDAGAKTQSFPPQLSSTDTEAGVAGPDVHAASRRRNHFHSSCLRRILKLRWQDRTPDTDVRERTGILSIYAMLRQLKVR